MRRLQPRPGQRRRGSKQRPRSRELPRLLRRGGGANKQTGSGSRRSRLRQTKRCTSPIRSKYEIRYLLWPNMFASHASNLRGKQPEQNG